MKPGLAFLGASFLLGTVCMGGPLPASASSEGQGSVLLEGMPSYYQRNNEFDGGGRKFCGPTAASNALMWLADHGYPNLKPAGENGSGTQTEMIKRLAGYMGTYREGTSVASFMCGVKSYLETAGYASASVVYSGNSCANRTGAPPDISLVRTVSAGNTAVWFSVGWYSFDAASRKYTRDHGHWVTLVGYGRNRAGEEDPNSYVIADPDSPDGLKYITLKRLDEGTITDGNSRMDANGFFTIAELAQKQGRGQDGYCILETIEAITIK